MDLPRPQNPPEVSERKGICFELSALYQARDPAWTLVHGEVNGPEGTMIDHAWLERDGVVFDPVLNESFERLVYQSRYAAAVTVRYAQPEAWALIQETRHTGPWGDERG